MMKEKLLKTREKYNGLFQYFLDSLKEYEVIDKDDDATEVGPILMGMVTMYMFSRAEGLTEEEAKHLINHMVILPLLGEQERGCLDRITRYAPLVTDEAKRRKGLDSVKAEMERIQQLALKLDIDGSIQAALQVVKQGGIMDKLGVDIDKDKTKTASQTKTCPGCGAELQAGVNVPLCPNCGTKPFEKAKEGE